MSEQPEALRLADAYADASFEQGLNQRTEDPAPEMARKTLEDELRRLTNLAYDQHSEIYGLRLKVMNLQKASQKQLNALHWIADRCPLMLMEQPLHGIHKEMAHDAGACARAAIGEAGEQK